MAQSVTEVGAILNDSLCRFVAGVQPWSDSPGNREGVSLNHAVRASLRNRRECSSLGKQLPVPNYQETTFGMQSLAVEMKGNHANYLSGPLLALGSQGMFWKQNRCQLLSRKSGWPWPQHKLALIANPESPQGLCHCVIYFVDDNDQELEMEGRSLRFGQEYTRRNKLILTTCFTQETVQELMPSPGDSWSGFV